MFSLWLCVRGAYYFTEHDARPVLPPAVLFLSRPSFFPPFRPSLCCWWAEAFRVGEECLDEWSSSLEPAGVVFGDWV